jgi:biopolymer transport protein ExbD
MKQGYQYETKISVVPIINVSLVIVLTLMLIAPFLSETEKQVNLPEARASEVDDTDNIEITYTLTKEIFIFEEQVTMAELRPFLAAIFAESPDAVAVVKADKALLYGEVEKLIAEVEAAEAPRIALATRQKGEGEG